MLRNISLTDSTVEIDELNQINAFMSNLLDSSDFPARWHCGRWSDFHGWLFIFSDVAIGLAYYAIPLMLLYFARARPSRVFHSIVLLFALFILACGTTHLIDAVMFWYPLYRVNALFRFFTAVVSWLTVIALSSTLPVALSMKTPEQLERIVEERTRELGQKNQELEELSQQLQSSYDDLEVKVRFRNLELERAARDLERENAELKARLEAR
jgi:hypothetical protein